MSPKRSSVKGRGREILSDGSLAVQEPPGDESAGTPTQGNIINIKLEAIEPNPDQPRKSMDDGRLEGLAASIRKHGILQPVIVKAGDGQIFTLMAGHRRYEAAKRAGLTKIPAVIRDGNSLEIALIENVQREDLHPLDESEGLQALSDRFDYTHKDLASITGQSRTTVTELLSLNRLPERIRAECRTFDIPKTLLFQVVRETDEKKQLALWRKITGAYTTVREAKNARKGRPSGSRPVSVYDYTSERHNCRVLLASTDSDINNEDKIAALLEALKDLGFSFDQDI